MNKDSNIIAIRKQDIALAHHAFVDLMCTTERILNQEAKENPKDYKNLTAKTLELCAVDKIKLACANSPFNADEVELISGQRFPDIVADKYYGIEVKSTKDNHWTSIGSSIVETTRVERVEDIFMLFGKLGGDVPQFRCRPYQDVLYDIAVTHSPRYLINMDLKEGDTIFSKMGTTYDEFRTSSDSISLVRNYYRERAKQRNRQEMPWWITSENLESGHSFNIRLWKSLELSEKRELQTKCMILFPEALNPATNRDKYNNTTLWLCSYNQVINPNIRDLYSAGGKITHVNGKSLNKPVAQVFNVIVEYSEQIRKLLHDPSAELLMMIKEYNPDLLQKDDLYEAWVCKCEEFAQENGVPLREWLNEKPTFLFSK